MDIPTRIQAILVDGETGTYAPVMPVSGTIVTTGTVQLANSSVTMTGTSLVQVVNQPVAVSVSNEVGIAGTASVALRNQPVAVNGTVVTSISTGTWPVSRKSVV